MAMVTHPVSSGKQRDGTSNTRPLKDIPMNFTEYRSASEIEYTPEDSLKVGTKMVENIKAHVNKLELGSAMRKEVWLKEIKR